MAQPMMKEDIRPPAKRRNPHAPRVTPEERARAAELERELGRPLRLDIEGPLTDDEIEEVVLARIMDEDAWIPASEFPEAFRHPLYKDPDGAK